MITITIAEVAVKRGTNEKGPWVNTRIKDTNGNWYGTFNTQAVELTANMTVSFEPIVKGNNKNFNEWVVSGINTPIDQPQPPSKSPISGEERGMWWKELGECIRTGELDKAFPNSAIRIKGEYYKKMSEVTNVNFKKEESN